MVEPTANSYGAGYVLTMAIVLSRFVCEEDFIPATTTAVGLLLLRRPTQTSDITPWLNGISIDCLQTP